MFNQKLFQITNIFALLNKKAPIQNVVILLLKVDIDLAILGHHFNIDSKIANENGNYPSNAFTEDLRTVFQIFKFKPIYIGLTIWNFKRFPRIFVRHGVNKTSKVYTLYL